MGSCTAHVRFRGKADIAFCGISLLRSLLGVKRTWLVAAHMSAFDPKRTLKPVAQPSRHTAMLVSEVRGISDEHLGS
jgi:hypothetical protein